MTGTDALAKQDEDTGHDRYKRKEMGTSMGMDTDIGRRQSKNKTATHQQKTTCKPHKKTHAATMAMMLLMAKVDSRLS